MLAQMNGRRADTALGNTNSSVYSGKSELELYDRPQTHRESPFVLKTSGAFNYAFFLDLRACCIAGLPLLRRTGCSPIELAFGRRPGQLRQRLHLSRSAER